MYMEKRRGKSYYKSINKKQIKLEEKNKGSNIKVLVSIKRLAQNLPNKQAFEVESQSDYLRYLSEILTLIPSIRIQQIPYVISAESYQKLITLLAKLTSHKEIVLYLLTIISKGFPEYSNIIDNNLFDILQLMIQMDELSNLDQKSLPQRPDDLTLHKFIVKVSIQKLVKQIMKWYNINKESRLLSEKYEFLLIKLQKLQAS